MKEDSFPHVKPSEKARGKSVNLNEYSNVEKVDLGGKLITPGIGDAHVHVSDIGWARDILDLHESR